MRDLGRPQWHTRHLGIAELGDRIVERAAFSRVVLLQAVFEQQLVAERDGFRRRALLVLRIAAADAHLAPCEQLVPVVLRQFEDVADHGHRDFHGEIRHEIDFAVIRDLVEHFPDQHFRPRLPGGQRFRHERLGDHLAHRIVPRRIDAQHVLSDTHRVLRDGRHLVVDRGHDATAFRAERRRIVQDLLQIRMPEDRPVTETVRARGPVHRILGAHAIEQRIVVSGRKKRGVVQSIVHRVTRCD